MSKLEQSAVNIDERWARDRSSTDVSDERDETTEEVEAPQPIARPELRDRLLSRRKK